MKTRERSPLPPPPPLEAVSLTSLQTAGLIGVRFRKLLRLRKTEGFPEPRLIGEELRWLRSEVMTWLESRPKGWSAVGGPAESPSWNAGGPHAR